MDRSGPVRRPGGGSHAPRCVARRACSSCSWRLCCSWRRPAVAWAAGWSTQAPWPDAAAFRAELTPGLGMLACVVRFARAEAARFGGDPSRLSLYGHSAGANHAANIAFAEPEVSTGCVAEAGSVVPEGLVLFDGVWLGPGHPPGCALLRH